MSKYEIEFDDYDYEKNDNDDNILEESEQSEKSEEIVYKKRGPKKKIVKKNTNKSLRLNDSDIDISDTDDMEDKNITNTNNIKPKPIIKKNKNNITLNTPWIEKYRPTNIEDLVLDEATINKLNKMIKDKNMQDIIITGVPGVGKTTTILCLAKNLLGKHFEEGVLELNASDERGIKTVQESIEYFCKKKIIFDGNCAQHKIVLLDEADNMTQKAQESIKNLMKNYHDTTRFAFTCNNASDIRESIQSRCIIFKYNRLTNEQISKRLKKICDIEHVAYTEEGLMSIITTSQGDLRKAINNLQLTYNGYGKITLDNVYRLCDKPHPLVIQNIFLECKNKNISKALEFLNDLWKKGYSSSDISLSMISTLRDIDPKLIDEKTRIKYLEEVSRTCIIINRGINTHLQLTGAICALYKLT